jgi:predicted phage-related endonuclease
LLVDPYAMDCEILDVPRNAVAEDKIARAVENFWQQVANGIEPSPDFGRDADVIAALRGPETKGRKIDFAGHNELPDMLGQRAALKARIEADKARCEEIETEIKFLMDDAEVVTGLPDWSITFKTTDYKGYSVPARSARVLRIKDKRERKSPP